MKERNHVVIGIIKRLDSQVTTGLGAEQFVAPATGPTRIADGIVCSGRVSAEKRDLAAVPTIASESGELCRASGTLGNKCSTGRHDDQASAYAQSTRPPYVCSSAARLRGCPSALRRPSRKQIRDPRSALGVMKFERAESARARARNGRTEHAHEGGAAMTEDERDQLTSERHERLRPRGATRRGASGVLRDPDLSMA